VRYERPAEVGHIHASLMHTLLYDGNMEIAEALIPQRLAVAAELYQRMPGYGVLAMAEPFMVRDIVADCTVRSLRAALEQPDDQLAEPVAYWLAVDAFEFDPKPWWQAMIAEPEIEPDPSNLTTVTERYHRRLTRVAEAGAEVNWKDKAPTLRRWVDHPELHVAVYRCLYESWSKIRSATEGKKFDAGDAREILTELKLAPDTPGYETLARAVEVGEWVDSLGQRHPHDAP
jgi:hypothetical protein